MCGMLGIWYSRQAKNARLAQLVEHHIDIVGVTGSSPVSRTFIQKAGSLSGFLYVQSPGLERFGLLFQ
jgi:hypothetical protein